MREHVSNWEEAKVVIKQHAEKMINDEEAKKPHKLRALFAFLGGLGISCTAAGITKQPAVILAMMPITAIASFAFLIPLIQQKSAYKKVMNDDIFKDSTTDQIIDVANRYIDQDNLTEKVKSSMKHN